MDLKYFVSVLRRWAWLLILAPAVTTGITWYGSERTEPTYEASTTVLVSPVVGGSFDYSSLLTTERVAKTYAELFTRRPVLQQAIGDLGLELTPRQLANMVSVHQLPNTGLVEIHVTDTDPELAADLANSLVAAFLQQNDLWSGTAAASYQETLTGELSALADEIGRLKGELARPTDASELAAAADSAGSSPPPDPTASLRETRLAYATLLSSLLQLQSAEKLPFRFAVIEPASAQAANVVSRVVFNSTVALVASLLLTLGFVFILDQLSAVVITRANAKEALHLPVLMGIPRIPARAVNGHSAYAATHPNSSFAEAHRTLGAILQLSHAERTIKTLLVTSVLPRAGKTTTVANLGVVMAQAGARVLLMDADLRAGSLHKQFGLSNNQGLTDLLTGAEPVESRFVPTDLPNLFVLPTGQQTTLGPPTLGAGPMERAIAAASVWADAILVDSPPVSSVADALVLAPRVDGVVLVLKDQCTPAELAEQALRQLHAVGATVLGVVLTHAEESGSGYYYYHNRPNVARRIASSVGVAAQRSLGGVRSLFSPGSDDGGWRRAAGYEDGRANDGHPEAGSVTNHRGPGRGLGDSQAAGLGTKRLSQIWRSTCAFRIGRRRTMTETTVVATTERGGAKVIDPLPTIWRVPDELWVEVKAILDQYDPAKRLGRKRIDQRKALNGVIFRMHSGCQWNQLPKEFGNGSSVHRTFQRWQRLGIFDLIWAALVGRCEELGGVDWQWQAADAALGKARFGGTMSAPTPR